MGEKLISPNDVVLHKPSGEKWVVAGVNHVTREVVPMGYPFPTIGKLEDCELIEEGYIAEPQPLNVIEAFMERGMVNFIDMRSAMFHGVFEEAFHG